MSNTRENLDYDMGAKPDMTMFLRPLSQVLKKLYHALYIALQGINGLRGRTKLQKGTICIHLLSFCCILGYTFINYHTPWYWPLHLPSNSDMHHLWLASQINFTQFNGFYGCCHCLQKGKRWFRDEALQLMHTTYDLPVDMFTMLYLWHSQ